MSRDKNISDPAPLGSLLGDAAGRFGLDGRAVGAVWRKWHEIVGPDVAAHAEPTSLRAGVLRVRADSPVWAHEIGYLADEIRSRTNSLLGRDAVTEVRIWSGPSKKRSASTFAPANDRAGGAGSDDREAPTDDPLTALDRARRAWSGRRRSGR